MGSAGWDARKIARRAGFAFFGVRFPMLLPLPVLIGVLLPASSETQPSLCSADSVGLSFQNSSSWIRLRMQDAVE